ncbi:MAG: hypothetical protein MI723_14635 [Caulobacterales bacterium]|nr:hypothetical protein [Caulobacterales bacterium]
MDEPHELGAQAFWRADFANAALSVHSSASRDLRVRLSGAATLWRWVVIVVMSVQAVIILNGMGVAGLDGALSEISALGVRLSLGDVPQTPIVIASFAAMGFYLVRAHDDEVSHSAQTQTLEFVGKNLMARMRYEEWRDQIVSSASNDRAIFIARCSGVVREFCRNPGVSAEDFEAVRAALRAEAPEPHPTLDIMNALDFSGHPQLKTLINGKKREFKDFVLTTKRRMSESFVDLEDDTQFARLAAELQGESEPARENDARRRRFSRAMRHFGWLDTVRDQIETGMPAYQLEGMQAFLIHDSFLENLENHFAKARRLFLYTNSAFVALWLVVNINHLGVLLERQPRW